MAFAIKAHVPNAAAPVFEFTAAKTMYRGKTIAPGDTAFLFASENEGGGGLVAKGLVMQVQAVPRATGPARQTPRVNVRIEQIVPSVRALGRSELKRFNDWNDGLPETELNFKLYRQATNKIVGISEEAANFLSSFF